jgi:hypothetical protein|tara:strand:- start:554 stop:751 length:198 start_codon:yes stop_codon:yes gene_type:complete
MEPIKIPLEHFTTLDGWTLETEIDEENKVFHITVSNLNGTIVSEQGEETAKQTVSFSLVKKESDE